MRQRGIGLTAFIMTIVMALMTGAALADSFYWYSGNSDWTNPDKWKQGSTSGSTGTVPTPELMSSGDYLDFGALKDPGVCNLSTPAGVFDARLLMYNNNTLNILDGGSLATGWGRVGNNTAAAINIGGNGSFQLNDEDLYIGMDGGHGELKMYDTSSLTTISTDADADTLHLSAYADGSTSLFQLNGSGITVDVDEFHILSNQWSGTSHMAATLEYVLDADGASTIITGQTGIGEGNGTAHLLLSAEVTPPQQDIVLIETTGTGAIGGTGVFNTVNGVPAQEGATVDVDGNIYRLTYQYDAAGDSANNDIALLYVMPTFYATEPSPEMGQTLDQEEVILSWKPADGTVRNEVYLGTDAAVVAAARKPAGDVDGNGTVDLSDLSDLVFQWLGAPSAPCPDLNYNGIVDLPDFAKVSEDWQGSADATYLGATAAATLDPGILEADTTYYWRVDSVSCDGIEPGKIWNFHTFAPPLTAFPGAEGFGAMANGGRGGDVYTVTNLNSSGAGSLRYGVENAPAAGRTIVFAVSGYIPINYNSDTGNQTVRIVQNNVTIAGQTAPGDGIGLKDGRILVTGNNVVLRHLRVRHGKYGGAGDCVNVESSADNCILDHISLMFSTDENISFFNSAVDNFTMQYCTSSWGMERHNAGGLWDLDHGTCHHTLWAHHRTRNPKARPYGLLEWINNVTCHWRSEGFIMGDSETPANWYANIIGCYYLSIADYDFGLDNTPLSKARIASDGQPNFHLYLNDTLIDANGDGVLNGTDKGYGIISGSPDLSSTPFTGAPKSVTIDDPLTAYKKVISSAGALRLDAAYTGPLRDELDDLLIESVENQESILVAKDTPVTTNPEEPPSNGEQHLADAYGISNNGFGTLNTAAAPTDTDGDGMPDFWERSIGSNASLQNHNAPVPADAYVSKGYTLLEEYLHFCAIPHAVISRHTASEPSSLSVDLRKFTRGFNAAPVVFSLSGIQNGLATIQPDGYTVVFEPTLDFSGRARFDFTVTDGDGSTWTQPLAVLVKSPPPPASPTGLWAQGTNTQVSLNWQDNAEPDLAGYNVYRTTTSGSAYVRVNPSLVTTSDYTDTEVVNGTLYHYIVRAVGTAMNESNDTSEVSARPVASGTDAIIQENTVGFCGIDAGGTIDNNHLGLTGDGFINTVNAIGEGVDWNNVTISSAGSYTVSWRYANGSGDRPGSLLVDGATAVSGISFPVTADWDTWTEVSRTVLLSAGSHTIRLEATGSSGLANIDSIEITGANVTPAACF